MTGFRTIGWILLLAGAVSACSEDRPPMAEAAEEDIRIVVLGSSTAEGAGPADSTNAWVNRYRAALQARDSAHQVINLAKGGYTTYHILPAGSAPPEDRPVPDTLRNITRALALEPDALIINLPSNDGAMDFTPDEQMANYARVAAEAEAAGVPVWITTTQPRNFSPEQRHSQLTVRDRILSTYGERAIDFWTGLADEEAGIDPAYDPGDGIHLNDAAHEVLFQRVAAENIPEALQPSIHGHSE